ncbi:MAG: alpha/beta hydrolase [Firmicutes bacterium]|nr:alpha/beta hydrolase [Bacillota bacterium]
MTKFSCKNTDIFFKRAGQGGTQTVVLLHGWGGSSVTMTGIFDFLAANGCDCIAIDLPGHGQSPNPPPDFDLFDYADCVCSLADHLYLKNVALVGHSFGGKLSILLSQKTWVKKIVLVSASGVKPRFDLKKYIKIKQYKRAKKRGLDLAKFGSTDFKALDPSMQSVFVKIVNTHLDKFLKKITKPTLLIWGKNDTDTPLYMAKKIKRRVGDCGLVTLEGGHYAFVLHHNRFCLILSSFLNP